MAPQLCTWFNRTPLTSSGSEQTAFKVCGACKIVCYCSTGCQKSDCKYHKLVCKQYAEFMSSTPRPSQLYKPALIFPVDTDNPAFRWVEFKYEEAGPESWEGPVHQPHLGPADSDGEVYFNRVEISKRLHLEFPTEQKYDLDHTVVAYVRDNWINDGSELNQSVEKMMNGERPMKWRGPMLAFSLPGTSGDPPFFQDFNLADIRVVADFLRVYDGLGRRDTGNRFVSLSGDGVRQFLDFGAN